MLAQKKYSTDINFYLYDTFDGMTEPTALDASRGSSAWGAWKAYADGQHTSTWDEWHGQKKWCYAPLEYVKKNIKLTEYNEKNVHYIIGDVLETLNKKENIPNEIALLRLDTDWYESTKIELETLASKVVVGGYIIIDDYNVWSGSCQATNDFLEKYNKKFLVHKCASQTPGASPHNWRVDLKASGFREIVGNFYSKTTRSHKVLSGLQMEDTHHFMSIDKNHEWVSCRQPLALKKISN
jgi:hypothetical protein